MHFLKSLNGQSEKLSLSFERESLKRFFKALAIVLGLSLAPGFVAAAYAGNWDTDSNGTPVFYVDNNPNIARDPNAPPGSARNKWKNIGDIDWTGPNGVEAANESNQPGQMHPPTSNFTGAPWTVIVNISGGRDPSGYQIYDRDPLVIRVQNNPYVNYAVVRREPGTGQVILRGPGSGVGIDLSYQSGVYIIGHGEISNTPDVLPAGRQGIYVCNWGVGMYVANSAYVNASGVELARNHVGVMCAHQVDLSFLGLSASFFTPNNDQIYDPLGSCAGAGVHLNDVWIRDNYDPTFLCQMFVANSIYSNDTDRSDPRGDRAYPSMIGCVVSDRQHPGRTDGVVNQLAYNDSGDQSYYYYWGSTYGPGLVRCISNLGTKGTSTLSCQFINPDVALHKSAGQDNEVCNCVFVMHNLNDSTGTARVIWDGQETPYDFAGSNSFQGGSFLLSGSRFLNNLGMINDLTNVSGNTVLLAPREVASKFTTQPENIADQDLQGWMSADFNLNPPPDYPPTYGPNSPEPGAYQDNPRFVVQYPPGGYASATNQTPGGPIDWGFPAGFDPGGLPSLPPPGGSPGGGGGGGGGGKHGGFLFGHHHGFGSHPHTGFIHGHVGRPIKSIHPHPTGSTL